LFFDPYTRAMQTAVQTLASNLATLAVVLGMASVAAGQDEGVVAVPAARQANTVAILPVEGEIDRISLQSLERRLREASRAGADAVVLELDTPGGEMLATLDICHLIRTEAPANTVAWINPKAFSAGTIIAMACRETLVHPEAVFGDAAPIQGIPILGLRQLPVAERAKLEAPLLSDLVESARRRGADEKLVQAFVAVNMELWLIEEIRTGERMFVDAPEYEIAFGEPPPQLRGRGAPLPGVDAAPSPPSPSEAAATATTRRILSSADRGRWRLVGQVIGAEELLTIRADESIAYGLASAKAADEEAVRRFFGATRVIRIDETWSESLVRFLVSWPVRLVLIVILLVCLFIELAVPGFGVFGIAAGTALLALIGAPALAGMAQWWEIALILAGLVLVAVELFVLPGFGVAGLAGALCLFAGLVGTFVGGDVGTAAWQQDLLTGLATTLGAVFAAGVTIWIVSRQVGGLRVFDRLVLAEGGGTSAAPAPAIERSTRPAAGALGRSLSELRPSGRAEFDGGVHDVRAVSGFVEAGRPVRVVADRDAWLEVDEELPR
jgi:membrane-bound serine protease (ClpP class)